MHLHMVPRCSMWSARRSCRRPTRADASTVAGYVRTYADGGRKHAFLVLSTSQEEYLRAYSIAPSQAMASLDTALGSSSSWSPYYRNRDVVIYELRSPEVDGP